MAKKMSPLDIMNNMGDAADKKSKLPKAKGLETPEEEAAEAKPKAMPKAMPMKKGFPPKK